MNTELPRLPVFGWASFDGPRRAPTDCMLDLPATTFTTSGRASILLALESLHVGATDRVLLPTYHCPTMVAPVDSLGAKPLFYPIDADGTPILAWLEAQDLRGVRAMLAAHFFGLPQPMPRLRRWCDERGIALIEDCAHALFGRVGGRAIGSWGDLAIGSLTKFLPLGEGGCLVANRPGAPTRLAPGGAKVQIKALIDILEVGARHDRLGGLNAVVRAALSSMRSLRPPPPSAPADAAAPPTVETVDEDFSIDLALAHRALAAPCRWVAGRLPRSRIVQQRRLGYEQLRKRLSGQAGMRPLMPALPADCAPYVFPLWVERPDPGYAELRRRHIPVFRWDRLWPGTPRIEGDQGLDWSHHLIQLACHQDLGVQGLDRLADAVLEVYASPGPEDPSRSRS